jgi:hypothetical protein
MVDDSSDTVLPQQSAPSRCPSPAFDDDTYLILIWYLVRPGCPAGSYSTGSPFELDGRDAALLP